jgi:hypothetical protein
MSAAFRAVVFTATFCLVYAAVYAPRIPTLLYYPRLNAFHFSQPDVQEGVTPVMMWYGWVFTALVAALVIALVIPRAWMKRGWLTISWIAPMVLMVYVVYHEWHWFTR